MSLISLIVTLIIIGILLWLVNTQLGQFIAQPILKIINVIVVVVVVLWLIGVVFGFGALSSVQVPTVR